MIRLPDSADLATSLFRALELAAPIRTSWHDALHTARQTARTDTTHSTLHDSDADTVTLATVAVDDSVGRLAELTETIVVACGTHLLISDTLASDSPTSHSPDSSRPINANPPMPSQPEPATPMRKGVEHLKINAKAKPNINKPYRRKIMPSTALKDFLVAMRPTGMRWPRGS